ncbi:hypothetical protein QLH51_03685 [Sphingomonas sp. 2R-10]|uniref:hypothetical protein n=1 Tax=Sphingomonas sp. 2R-10 TaxID=3045148 RepID=UPI000F794F37|nr:hypothetical protein [Sphingomonas sp. 2R-10]MDJ0275903.1 hypothetical protein [Sphingomonas sp. 2R-10]
MTRLGTWLAAGATLLGVGGCAGGQAATNAAMALAEAHHPGRLEPFATRRLKDRYRVILAIRGDPVTRIAFDMDADPATCRLGSPCDRRFLRAYDHGVLAGDKVNALDAALRDCGIKALGIEGGDVVVDFRTVIELDLPTDDQQSVLDRLTPCIAAFRRGLSAQAPDATRALRLRILAPDPARASVPLRFEIPAEAGEAAVPSFLIGLAASDAAVSAAMLRLDPDWLRRSGVRNRLARIAQSALDDAPGGGTVPPVVVAWGTKLDARRLDTIRTYILACSGPRRAGTGACRADLAVRMRYDLDRNAASEIAVTGDIRDERGGVFLPELPGR